METKGHSQRGARAPAVRFLRDPVARSPPGSSVRGSFLGENTGVGYHALFQGDLLDLRDQTCVS